ncbi:MAG: insulinase family protein [Bacteroidales bacterium]|nr:insulinase family protein [Bacteroidales bacterium]
MKNQFFSRFVLFGFLFAFSAFGFSQKQYSYKTVPNDPLNARIYTLDNGLQVYLTVYKDAPRIQAYVAVKVGSKNDPSETTGLAHYFEHMMFKGTPEYGSMDWEKEKGLIAAIENQFEIYRNERNETKRAAIYHVIDSLSYEASKLAIPNEYDKLMKTIGSQGTNAGTSNDYTIYIENIPSNQLKNWAKIQLSRFSHPVLRLFHTELETVYEEKNMSLTNDGRKAFEAMFQALYPNHPYGTQTTLGETEHLKNPSMKNIREFFDKYYIPNNMAVVLSGDFNPDEAIKIIDETFGTLKRKPLPDFKFKPEPPIAKVIEKDVMGLDAENIRIAYRFGGAASSDAMMVNLLSTMLSNGKAGLIDLNVNQKQRTLDAGSFPYVLADYSSLVLYGSPKSEQTLDDVRTILLDEVTKLKKGDFPDWMLEAAINNLKLQELKQYESNQGRGMAMARAFMNNIPWEKSVNYINEVTKVTKKDLVDFANKHLADNYVVIYKRQGKDENETKVTKPLITPIHINRDVESKFMKNIKAEKVSTIEPVFVDFDKDITRIKLKNNIEMLYTKNSENSTFNLYYYFKIGRYNDKKLDIAVDYLPYLGTSKMTAEQINQELYKLACSFNVSAGAEETWVSISGLSENMDKAIKIVEDLLADPKADQKALNNLVNDVLKSRTDAKANQRSNFSALVSYGTYGENSPRKYILSESELKALKADELVSILKNLFSYEHQILAYSPATPQNLKQTLDKLHKSVPKSKKPNAAVKFEELETSTNRVVFAQYDSKQSYLQQVTKSIKYQSDMTPIITLYNSYFGGSMNAIVFQELREKRGLAYTARSTYETPNRKGEYYINNAFIATQNDKVIDAFDAYNDLFDNMPVSLTAFELSKESIITSIQTNRITKMGIIWNYLSAERKGLNYDIRKDIYKKVPEMSIQDIVKFNDTYLQNKTKTYLILGNESDLDFKELEKYGKIQKVSLEDIFGY